jgi:hypothetical protein
MNETDRTHPQLQTHLPIAPAPPGLFARYTGETGDPLLVPIIAFGHVGARSRMTVEALVFDEQCACLLPARGAPNFERIVYGAQISDAMNDLLLRWHLETKPLKAPRTSKDS